MDFDVDNKVPYAFEQRSMSVIPYGIRSTIKSNAWRKILSYVAGQMRDLKFYASRFISMHILRILNQEKLTNQTLQLPTSKTMLCQLFKCISYGSKEPKCDIAKESLKIWNDLCKSTNIKLPNIQNSNTVSTKVFEDYFVAFENYHKYGLCDHYVRMIRSKYDLSKKMAIHVTCLVFKSINLPVKQNIEDTCENSSIKKTKEFVIARDTELVKMNTWKEKVKTLDGKIRLHHMILCNSEKNASIAPLCASQLPFIPVCLKTLQDLYRIPFSKKHPFQINIDSNFVRPEHVTDILSHKDMKKLNKKYYIRTIRTNGVVVNIQWSKNVVVNTMIKNEKYDELMKKHAEYKRKKDAIISKQLKEKGKVNKNTTRKRDPKIRKRTFECPKKEGLLDASYGVFTKSALLDCKIPENVPIVSIDPGHKNVLTASCTTLKDSKPITSAGLSLKEYYHEIGNNRQRHFLKRGKKHLKLDVVENKLSENSLKTQNIEEYKSRLTVVLELSRKLFAFYGSRNQARRKFARLQNRQRFLTTIAERIAPNKDTIIALGDAKFAVCRPGLSACLIAKVVQELAKSRRVVITPEYNTTKRCSHCKSICANTISGRSTIWKTNRKGQQYRPQIHGLRHCLKCTRSLNRDENASRNIFNMFKSFVETGNPAEYLKKTTKKSYSDVAIPNAKRSRRKYRGFFMRSRGFPQPSWDETYRYLAVYSEFFPGR